MTGALLEKDCVGDECKVVGLEGLSVVEAALTRFVCAIDNDADLELLGTDIVDDKEIFIVKNHLVATDVEGHCIEVDVNEVADIATTKERAQGFVDAFRGDRNDAPVKGYTRIVGYYSGVQNWSKSKVGELRDRAKGQYGTGKFGESHRSERMKTIDNVSLMNQ